MANPTWDETVPLYDETSDVSASVKKPEDLYRSEDQKFTEAESFGRGVQSGTTLGFRDEIAALAGAAGASSGGDTRPFWDIYRDILDVQRDEQAQSSEQNPMSSLAGELTGSFITPSLGAGALAKGGMTASKIAKGRQIVQGGKEAIDAAKLASKIGQVGRAGAVGAAAGAISGLGASEADLTKGEIGKAVKDMSSGALLGAGLGAGIQGAGQVIGRTLDAAKKLPYVEDTLKVRELVKEGHAIADQSKNISKESRDLAKNILDELDTMRTFTGAAVGKSKEEAEQLIGNIKINDVVNNIRTKIKALKPTTKQEKEEVDALKDALSNILEETEKVHYKYVPKGQLPKASATQKAEEKVMKKTAEAETKDAIKYNELIDEVERLVAEGAEIPESLTARIKALESKTQFPGVREAENLTGLDVLGVPRGPKKSPIVEAIVPEAEPTFTPVSRKRVGSETIIGRPEISPSELQDQITSLQDLLKSSGTTKGRRAIGSAMEDLRGAQTQAAQNKGEAAQKALSDLGEAKSAFKGVREVQESFGIPKFAEDFDPNKEKNIIDSMQRAILGLTDDKISSDRFLETMDDLARQFPQAADRIRKQAKSISERYDLSQMMSAQSLEGVKRGGLALPAMMARGMEFATSKEQAAKNIAKGVTRGVTKGITSLGKTVYDASPEQLQQFADYMVRTGGKAGNISAQTLSRIFAAPEAKRRALLFTLMQQPDFRRSANEFFESSDSSEDEQNQE